MHLTERRGVGRGARARAALGLALTLLLGTQANAARAVDPDVEPLTAWAHDGKVQRNRVHAAQIPAKIQKLVLDVLAAGVQGCDCRPRALRWMWALPRPQDGGEHPALLVAFEDRPRERGDILLYERYALLAYGDGVYRVRQVLNLKRPFETSQASLRVTVRPRRDSDLDGQLDIVMDIEERWPEQTYCAWARVESRAAELTVQERDCAAEKKGAAFKASR